jgi:hypothetical protein
MLQKHSVIVSVLLTVMFLWVLPIPCEARSQQQFISPSQITLQMYVLKANGAIDFDVPGGNPACYSVTVNRTKFGCTYFDGGIIGKSPVKSYPFTSDTIPIGIESQPRNNIQQGYLHNVISQEMTEGSPLASYTAQAIAARTYAYYQIKPDTPGGPYKTINNSSAKQVYLPYRYDGLGAGLGATIKAERQNTVNLAITLPGALYMTLPTDNEPIAAYFGADNCAFTKTGTETYLKGIYDPISEKPAPCDNDALGTRYGGMGSAGASRWGYGNTSEYGTGNRWSVKWQSGLQILTHYYTGIHIRNASGNIITPAYRWVPLKAFWNGYLVDPPIMSPNVSYFISIELQNSGTVDWVSSSLLRIAYQWKNSTGAIVGSGNTPLQYTASSIPQGLHSTTQQPWIRTPATPGMYTLVIDMMDASGTYFHNREAGRPWFTLDYQICLPPCSQKIYLPLIMKNAL